VKIAIKPFFIENNYSLHHKLYDALIISRVLRNVINFV